VDPALKGPTGIAWFEDEKLLSAGTIPGKHIWSWEVRKSKLAGSDVLVIEEQGLFSKGKLSQNAMMAAYYLWFIPAHDMYKIPIHKVEAHKWLTACQRGYRRGKTKKDLAVLKHYIKARFGVDVASPDIVSAICLGAYYLDNLRKK